MKTQITKEVSADLRTIAKEINEREAAIEQLKTAAVGKAGEAVTEALLQGQSLIKAQKSMPHGYWEGWLKSHCPGISQRTAQVYMRLAKAQHAADLSGAESLREAMRLLAPIGTAAKDPKTQWPVFMEGLNRIHGFVKFLKSDGHSVDAWPDEGKEKLRTDLEPVARVLWPERFA